MTGFKVVISLLACVLLTSAFKSEANSDNYIVGGRNANRNQFPWMISLRDTSNAHRCGGFIMSDRWIGTAAHCTQNSFSNPNSLIAVSGAHTLTDGNRHRLVRIINHPRYNARFRLFDVSILQTVDRMPVTAQGPIRTIRFPRGPVVHDFSTVYVAGWGQTEHPRSPGQGLPSVLQWKATRTIPRQQCKDRHGPRSILVHADTVCTLSPDGKGACMGDSGGPLVDRDGFCIGIVSWSMACATGYPDVYAKLWTAIPFIRHASQNTIPNLPHGQ